MIPVTEQNEPVIFSNDLKPEVSSHENLKLNTTDQKIKTIGQESLNKNDDSISFLKIAEPVVQWTSSIGATGTTITAIIALAFFVHDQCSQPIAPFIAAVAVAGVSNFLTVAKDFYDMKSKSDAEKSALLKEKERNDLENKRHKELSDLLIQTLATVQRYQISRDQAHFKECIQSIKNIPDSSSNQPDVRDLWLSTLIQMSNDEDKLKSTLTTIHGIATKIEQASPAIAKVTLKDKEIEIPGQTTRGEGKNRNDLKSFGLINDLEQYLSEWTKMEEKVGFPIHFIEKDHIRYQRDGQMIKSDQKKEAIIEKINFNQSSDDDSVTIEMAKI